MDKTTEPRSLLDKKTREIEISECLTDIFRNWYKRFTSRTNEEPRLIDVFYAGYVFSNPVVRDKYKEAEKLGL